jgi:prepilin-type N-terminal cleavage/methylation domain-containing protein
MLRSRDQVLELSDKMKPLRRMRSVRMSSQKGFTVVEFMVAVVLLALLLLSAGSLFVYQTKSGREATQRVSSSEGLTMALNLMVQDVMHAGYGLFNYSDDRSSVSLFLDTTTNPPQPGTAYRRMFLSYGKYLNDISICSSTATFTNTVGSNWMTTLSPSEVGGLISEEGGTKAVSFLLINPALAPTFSSGTNKYTYNLSQPLKANDTYAPAVAYYLGRYYNGALDLSASPGADRPYNVLLRNGPTADGRPQILLGGGGDLRVVDLLVWAYFFDGARHWAPTPIVDSNLNVLTQYQSDDAKTNFADCASLVPNLRWLEIWIGYQYGQECASSDSTKDVNGKCWGATVYSKTRVSPRNLRLQ